MDNCHSKGNTVTKYLFVSLSLMTSGNRQVCIMNNNSMNEIVERWELLSDSQKLLMFCYLQWFFTIFARGTYVIGSEDVPRPKALR